MPDRSILHVDRVGMQLCEVRRHYPATVALYSDGFDSGGFGLFLARTSSGVHGNARTGVTMGVGSGRRVAWTADQVRAAAVRLLLLVALGCRRGAGVSTTYEQLLAASWHPTTLTVDLEPNGALITFTVTPELMEEHCGRR